jgi:hypothetical protein
MRGLQQILTLLRSTLTLGALTLGACGSSDEAGPQRSYYMGFTPWPYAATTAAVDDVYAKIQSDGDIVAHHVMDGIPWAEAYAGGSYHANVEGSLTGRQQKTLSNRQVFLALESLNGARDDLAGNWGAGSNEALPAPWNSYDFDDQQVADAYTAFALDLIARFQPLYFNYGTEVSELILNDPARYARFKIFASRVYAAIKAKYPSLPLMVSVALKEPGSAEMNTLQTQLAGLLPYVDVIGVSVYPYAFFGTTASRDPDTLSIDWLRQIRTIAPGKRIAITETGWIAENLTIPAFSLAVTSSEILQEAYVARLLQEADLLGAEFLIWFTIADYDTLWNLTLGQDPLAQIWKDTGLYDGSLTPRSALTTWRAWLSKPLR